MRRPSCGEGDPKLYRYEIQGPNALALMEKATGADVPHTRFFGMTTFTIDGVTVRSLRHGMAGQPGFELFGPWAEGERVRAALIAAGEGLDLVLVGSKAYSSANLESAWVPSPLPAIYSGEGTEAYREWLPAARAGSLAGSVTSERIEDFYVTPYDLGYGRSVAFDHDFIGRAALERHAAAPQRVKVTLVWNPEDVAAAMRSLFEPGIPAKYIDLPKARYGQHQVDRVLSDGAGCRHLARRRLHHERARLRLAREHRDGVLGAGDRGRGGLGRGAQLAQARGRAAPPGDDPRDGAARAVLGVCAGELPQELRRAARGPVRCRSSGARAIPARRGLTRHSCHRWPCNRHANGDQAISRRAPITLSR